MTPEDPADDFVRHYLLLIPCQSFSDFQKVLDLKVSRNLRASVSRALTETESPDSIPGRAKGRAKQSPRSLPGTNFDCFWPRRLIVPHATRHGPYLATSYLSLCLWFQFAARTEQPLALQRFRLGCISSASHPAYGLAESRSEPSGDSSRWTARRRERIFALWRILFSAVQERYFVVTPSLSAVLAMLYCTCSVNFELYCMTAIVK